MPIILSAKEIVEQSLRKIGRIPSTQAQADPVELRTGLTMLELVLLDFFGQMSVTSAWGTVRVPLLSSKDKYELKFYETDLAKSSIQFVYSAELLEVASGNKTPLDIINEEKFFKLNFNDTGIPSSVYINKGPDTSANKMQIHPMLGPEVPDGTYEILLHVQTFPTVITSTGKERLNIRPTYYLWAITKLSYQLGTGTIRRLPKQETDGWKVDYEEMEMKLTAFDGDENDNQPFTQPWGQ